MSYKISAKKVQKFIICTVLIIAWLSYAPTAYNKLTNDQVVTCGVLVSIYGDSMTKGKYPKQEFWGKVALDGFYYDVTIPPSTFYKGETNVQLCKKNMYWPNSDTSAIPFFYTVINMVIVIMVIGALVIRYIKYLNKPTEE